MITRVSLSAPSTIVLFKITFGNSRKGMVSSQMRNSHKKNTSADTLPKQNPLERAEFTIRGSEDLPAIIKFLFAVYDLLKSKRLDAKKHGNHNPEFYITVNVEEKWKPNKAKK